MTYLKAFVQKIELENKGEAEQPPEQAEALPEAVYSARSELSKMMAAADLQTPQADKVKLQLLDDILELQFNSEDIAYCFDEKDGNLNCQKWWKNKGKQKYSNIILIFEALIAAPPTQVASERICSKLKIIL